MLSWRLSQAEKGFYSAAFRWMNENEFKEKWNYKHLCKVTSCFIVDKNMMISFLQF